MSLAQGSDVADAVAPGAPLQMTLGATTDFLSTYTQTHTRTHPNERAQKAQFSTSKCRPVFVRGIFIFNPSSAISYNRKLKCVSIEHLITQYCDSTVSEQTQSASGQTD